MNIYLQRYHKLINHYKNILVKGYGENHHILPRCMGGNDDKENIVRLTAKAHYVAHHLLHKAYPQNRKLANAFAKFLCANKSQKRYNINAKRYEQLRIACSIARKGAISPLKGQKLSEEHRQKIAAINRKRNSDPEFIAKLKTINPDPFKEYNIKKQLEGWTKEEIENKAKAGRAKRGVKVSESGRKGIKEAAIKRTQKLMTCFNCNHTGKHSPNFFRYHNKNCRVPITS